jgi:hypothetical protein
MCVAHLTSKRRSNICSSSSGIRSSSSRESGSARSAYSGRRSSCRETTPSRSGRQRLTDTSRSFLGRDANVVDQHIVQLRLFEKGIDWTRHKIVIATRRYSVKDPQGHAFLQAQFRL